jgi:hypothetical protein
MKVGLKQGVLTLGLALLASVTAFAQTATHPHYIHARSDLAKARQLMQLPEEGNVAAQMRNALAAVNKAIAEIDNAAKLDHKDMDDRPPVDTGLKCLNKFQEIFKLLRAAKIDIDQEEDNPASRTWRGRANNQIDEARQYTRKAILLDEADDVKVR